VKIKNLPDVSTKRTTPSANDFLVVGVGASAGGLDAFKQLIKAIPIDSGIAFILVQHLDPSHDSILCELLQKITLIPIHEVTDKIHVEPDHIYVIPPNKMLTANDGILNLTDRPPKTYHNLPIDVFFRSLAEVHQAHAIGVVLSGTGKDGTLGLKAIKENGGITFAQHHNSAGFVEMPQNAISAKVVDFVLTPEGIVHQLIEISKVISTEKAAVEKPEDLCFRSILSILDERKGVDFTYYKQTTIHRRIRRRVALKNFATLQDYLEYLKVNPAELDTLFNDILIPVTEFFRDPGSFEALCRALPDLIKNKKPNESLRVWCVGCSTGQEAYALAICLHEFASSQSEPMKVQIFATDVSDRAIMKARSASYSNADVATLSPERLRKYFVKSENGYQVHKIIRDLCVFATHNIIVNPPFAGIDLVSCRNVLIYMDNFLQRKAMATFHYSLNENGKLFLGRSESIGNSSDLFSASNERDKLYTKTQAPGRFIHITPKRRVDVLAAVSNNLAEIRPPDDFQRSADEWILSQAPAGVIVNDHHEIVQFRGVTGDWLEAPPGKPSLNVLKMAKYGLSVDLRNALLKAKTSKKTFVKENIAIQLPTVRKLVTIEVTPLMNTINAYYLILFRDAIELPLIPAAASKNNGKKAKARQARETELEEQLVQTRQDMRSITDDQEAGNQELLSANEELLSGSEELRSLNEELEISKEELQSTVEELSVANQELAFRNEQITYSRKYSEAIVTTIREPLVVLDKDLRVKSANSAFYNTFFVTDKQTEGEPFYEIDKGQWNIPALRAQLAQTLSEANFSPSYEVKVHSGKTGERIILLNSRKISNELNGEHLVLVAMEDITDQRTLEQTLKASADYTRLVLDSSPHITCTASEKGKFTYANKFFLDYAGLTLEQAIRLGWQAVVHADQLADVQLRWQLAIGSGKKFFREMLIRRHDGAYCWHIVQALPIRDADGKVTSWVCSAADVHNKKLFTDELEKQIRERTLALKESNAELQHSNKNLEQFAFIASHDLQEPLRKIKTFSNMLSENYGNAMPEEGKKLIEKIHGSSDRMSSLIQDVLNFSRINNEENAFVKTDINLILKNVMEDFALLIDEKHAEITAHILPVVDVIPLQINQLFYNLISNSLKFCEKGSNPVITVSARTLSTVEVMNYTELDKRFEYFEILVADKGIGFNQEFESKIFEIFQRLNSRDQYAGTGIGLALCKKIALNHNGLIFGESHEGVGALFHVILPQNRHHTAVELLPGYAE
jgi:two-component system CheB/CheR fusion protein